MKADFAHKEEDPCVNIRLKILLPSKPAVALYPPSFMENVKIIAYLKPQCGWSQGVRAVLRKYDLAYEDRDIINDPAQRQEMIEKTGQMLSPCVEVNGRMLADVSGEEVEAYLVANNLVRASTKVPEAPIDQPCAHEMPAPSPLSFRR